jgi:hypothetical protein
MRYLVFYVKGGRIGSVPLTSENLSEARRTMRLALVQRDATGTEHYSVLSA